MTGSGKRPFSQSKSCRSEPSATFCSMAKIMPTNGPEKAALSEKQNEVLKGLADGHTYQQIAESMGVSIHTVRNHVRRIYQKLDVKKCAQAVAKQR
jgi:DNA-binding CsgD family transcriptional regulator